MGKNQNRISNKFSAWGMGLQDGIIPQRPFTHSWIPLGMSLPVLEGPTPPLPLPTSSLLNEFNLKVDDLVGNLTTPYTDPITNRVFPGGRPLPVNIQNSLVDFYSQDPVLYAEELSYLSKTNHTYISTWNNPRMKWSHFLHAHRGGKGKGGTGGGLNLLTSFLDSKKWVLNQTFDGTLSSTVDTWKPDVLHPAMDSLFPFIHGIQNFPQLTFTVEDGWEASHTTIEKIPPKFYYFLDGLPSNPNVHIEFADPPYLWNVDSQYTQISDKEANKKLIAPMHIVYLKYNDPVIKYLMDPTCKINFRRIEHNLRGAGYPHQVFAPPKVIVFLPSDNVAYTLLSGMGSRGVNINTRTMNICRGLSPRDWHTHSFDHSHLLNVDWEDK